MYSDLTYDISTTSEFSEELHKLLAKVAATLKLEANVKERLAVAKKIREKYKIVGAPKSLSQSLRKRRRRRKKFLVGEEEEEDLEEDEDREDWGKLLGGVETSADVQMEWLRMRMHPEDHSLNLTKKRAEFTLLFPSAKPVSYQDGNEEDEEEEDRHDGTEGETSPGFFAK
ncbi:transmembrane [Cystoisospora suis]|uniref:Transmembrane n=1 Tax=Cystoisospora suis TaxID=483139 RepID=A0A2C6KVP3_9APIC|nr:transmembrane [Cystoisospora suis]